MATAWLARTQVSRNPRLRRDSTDTVSEVPGQSNSRTRATNDRAAFYIALLGGAIATAVALQTNRPASAIALIGVSYFLAVGAAYRLRTAGTPDRTRRRVGSVVLIALILAPIVIASIAPLRRPVIYDVVGVKRPAPVPDLAISLLRSPGERRLNFVVANPLKSPQTMSELSVRVISDTGKRCQQASAQRYRLLGRLRVVASDGSPSSKASADVASEGDPGFLSKATGSYTRRCGTTDLQLSFHTSIPIAPKSSRPVSLDAPRRFQLVGPRGSAGRDMLSPSFQGYVELGIKLAPSGRTIRSCLSPCLLRPRGFDL